VKLPIEESLIDNHDWELEMAIQASLEDKEMT